MSTTTALSSAMNAARQGSVRTSTLIPEKKKKRLSFKGPCHPEEAKPTKDLGVIYLLLPAPSVVEGDKAPYGFYL